jgi:hypothetical protein
MKNIKFFWGLVRLYVYIHLPRNKKIGYAAISVVILGGLIYLLRFRCIPGYNWDLSITASEFLVGAGSLIGALGIVIEGIVWLVGKLNKNTTTITSIQPYLWIGDEKEHYPIKSQHEFTQIIRDLPLEILQSAHIAFFVSFNSKDKNEAKIVYKTYFKPHFGFKWVFETQKNEPDDYSKKMARAKSFLLGTKYYEDYIIKSPEIKGTAADNIHKLECELPLDPFLFLLLHKSISLSVKIENSNKSKTSWCTFKLFIEDEAKKAIAGKIPELKTEEEKQRWIEKWKKDFQEKNENIFDLEYKKCEGEPHD